MYFKLLKNINEGKLPHPTLEGGAEPGSPEFKERYAKYGIGNAAPTEQ